MSNINRIDNMTFTGFRVTFQRDGKRIQEYFSVNEYGTMDKAFDAAEEFYDRLIDRWELYCANKSTEPIRYHYDSDTGYPGINVTAKRDKGRMAGYFQLSYTDPETGQHRQKVVYIAYLDDPEYFAKYRKKLQKARRILDKINYARFGGRWGLYKRRWHETLKKRIA